MAANFHPFVCSCRRALFQARCSSFLPEAVLLALFAACLLLAPGAAAQTRTGPKPGDRARESVSASAGAAVLTGKDGWLFLPSELRFLQFPVFWGEQAKSTSRSSSPDTADPLKAIAHFRDQLRAEGIRLLVVPVPPKALALRAALPPEAASSLHAESLAAFLEQLRANQIETVDLLPVLAASANSGAAANAPGEPLYCKTDSHWSGSGCEAAAKAIAEALRPTLDSLPKSAFRQSRVPAHFRGDLEELKSPKAPTEETLSVRQISTESGSALQPDPASPLLLLGDSHTLVFHDFLAERAGLLDQLAFETGIVPDLIGTRGSGANAVRVSLLRRNVKDPQYLASKKVVVWCFAAREFTESDQGWQNVPLKK